MPLNNPWIECWIAKPQAEIRLFCFPYAGGGAGIFRAWPKALPEWIEVCPIQLPGRWGRIQEPLHHRMDTLIAPLTAALLPLLDKPFAFFGHSMGALLAFECLRALRRMAMPPPKCFFPSAHLSPRESAPKQKTIHNLPEPQLIDAMLRMKGTPPEILQHPEWLQLFLPVIRADLEIVETYQYRDEPPLNCPIIAFCGSEDPEAPPVEMDKWRTMTENSFQRIEIEGDHFFIQSRAPKIWAYLVRALENARED